jgi:hypothetical protein
MRLISMLAALLLLIGACSCSGGALKTDDTRDSSAVFTLSDAEIDAYEASPEVTVDDFAFTGSGRQIAAPRIFAEQIAGLKGAGDKAASTWWHKSKCDKCKSKCGKCNEKSSCKCKGGCKKCSSCKDKCGKCSKKSSCGCQGNCQKKCDSCKSNCGKCSKDRNCGCDSKCKQKCNSCKGGCDKCAKNGNCGCKAKCKEKCKRCDSSCRKCNKNGNCGCKAKCDIPPPCPCDVKCKSIKSIGEVSYTKDCETGCADATYKVQLTFTDCPGVDNEALGREVVFTRNGIEVGRASTDINGQAWITDLCLQPGTYNIKASYDKCFVCFDICINDQDCCEVACTGLTSSTAARFEADCDTHVADVTYNVNLAFNDCPDVADEAANREIVFMRDNVEVGRATTDTNGNASFTDSGVGLGAHSVSASYAGGCETTFQYEVWEECCEVECIGMVNDSERFFTTECFEKFMDVDLSVQVQFSECPGVAFDKSGYEVTFTADGNVVGTALTDANGVAGFTWAGAALGNHHIVAAVTSIGAAAVVIPDEHCMTEFDITVWDECRIHACVSGKGKIPGKNGAYGVFLYEAHVNAGQLEMVNKMSYADGAVNFSNVDIEWIVVNGAEIYFGNDDIMMHTIDLGKAPGVDFFEIFVFSAGYHNSSLLLNGQIRSSWGIYKPGDPLKVL